MNNPLFKVHFDFNDSLRFFNTGKMCLLSGKINKLLLTIALNFNKYEYHIVALIFPPESI